MQGLHQQIVLAVNGLLAKAEGAFFDDGADAGGGEHAAKACAACTDHLREGALGDKGHFKSAVDHGLLSHFGVKADVGSDHPADLLVVDELCSSVVFLAHRAAGAYAVIADVGEILDAALGECVDEPVSVAAAHKAAEHHCCAVGDQFNSFLDRYKFGHRVTSLLNNFQFEEQACRNRPFAPIISIYPLWEKRKIFFNNYRWFANRGPMCLSVKTSPDPAAETA